MLLISRFISVALGHTEPRASINNYYLLSAKSGDTTVTDGYKRFDAGINGSVALEYQRFYLRLGAEYGLLNLNKSGVDDLKVRNVGFFTTVVS